jgi:adenylate kinase
MSPKNDRAAWLQGPAAQCATPAYEPPTPYRLVLLGAPGVGKGTQAELLHQNLGACHLSTGDVFRAAGSQPDCAQSPAIKEALAHVRRGELVPDATVWAMVRERKACLHCRGGFILDGFPRTLGQAASLEQFLRMEDLSLTAVVSYELPASEIVARLGGRRTCETCKAVYHVTERPSHVPGRCDHCAGKLIQREDDRPESIKVRLDVYERSTAPLLEFYANSGLLLQASATGTPEEIYKRTVPELQSRRVSRFAEQAWKNAEYRRSGL